jgi:hypothetical protein
LIVENYIFDLGPTPNLVRPRRFTIKKYSLQPVPAPGKPLPTYRVPRMPTEKEIADVLFSFSIIHFFFLFSLFEDYHRLSTSM